MSLKVSIIMNCYNGERYLKDSLISILNQTYKNWELIFWDNQSDDNSKKIFFSFKDNRFKYYYSKKFTNLYQARNLALTKASGDIISFLDVDDIWLQYKLEEQIKKFNDKKINLVYGNYFIKNQFGNIKKKKFKQKFLPTGYITDYLLKEYCVGFLTVSIRKVSLSKYKNIFNSKLNLISDYDFILNYSLNNRFDCVQKPIAIYREHPNQQQRKLFYLQVKDFCIWFKQKKNYKKFPNYKFLKEKYFFYNFLLNIKKKSFLQNFFKILNIKNSKIKFKLLVILFFEKIYINYIFKAS